MDFTKNSFVLTAAAPYDTFLLMTTDSRKTTHDTSKILCLKSFTRRWCCGLWQQVRRRLPRNENCLAIVHDYRLVTCSHRWRVVPRYRLTSTTFQLDRRRCSSGYSDVGAPIIYGGWCNSSSRPDTVLSQEMRSYPCVPTPACS